MNTQVSLAQAACIITHVGNDVTFLLQGQPGIGKSSILPVIAQATGLKPVYVDCTILDVGDVQMPRVTDDSVKFVPNSLFVSDQPLLIMLDEIGKAPRSVQNVLLPLIYERRVGAHHLPEGSRVFCTTNLVTDGVGDALQGHAINRMGVLQVRNPTAQEWIEWATNNGVHPVVTAWVQEYPHCLASYLDVEHSNNPYVYRPQNGSAPCVTPRSLAAASHVLYQDAHFPEEVLHAALCGIVGASAASDMAAFLSLRGEVFGSWERIMREPVTAPLSSNPLANILLCHAAQSRIAADTDAADPWMQYLIRMDRELQYLFAVMASKSADVMSALTTNSATFRDWIITNRFVVQQ